MADQFDLVTLTANEGPGLARFTDALAAMSGAPRTACVRAVLAVLSDAEAYGLTTGRDAVIVRWDGQIGQIVATLTRTEMLA